MNDFSPIYKHIPLSEDYNNWWYVGRKQFIGITEIIKILKYQSNE